IAPIDSAGRGVDAADTARVGAKRRAALSLEMPCRDSRSLRIGLAVARPPVFSRPVANSACVRAQADFIPVDLIAADAGLRRSAAHAAKRCADGRRRWTAGMIDGPIVCAIPLAVPLGAAKVGERDVLRQSAGRPFDREAV